MYPFMNNILYKTKNDKVKPKASFKFSFQIKLSLGPFAGLPPRSLFREKVAIGTFLPIWVLKGSLKHVKSPYFTNFYENNAYFPRKSVTNFSHTFKRQIWRRMHPVGSLNLVPIHVPQTQTKVVSNQKVQLRLGSTLKCFLRSLFGSKWVPKRYLFLQNLGP